VGCNWDCSSWGSVNKVMGPLLGGTHVSAIDRNSGQNVRIYYQRENDDILEKCNDGGVWFNGAVVVMTY
jgi:hypothetical protein